MTTHDPLGVAPDRDDRFDRTLRALHADALAHVSPSTRLRLRPARPPVRQPIAGRGAGWAMAGAVAATVALAVGLQFTTPHAPTVPEHAAALGDYDNLDSTAAVLDENPDLYLWLASNTDALPSTAEQ